MKRLVLLLSLGFLAACGAPAPTFVQTGTLAPGATIVVRNVDGDVNVYAPERGQPSSEYTIGAYEVSGGAHTLLFKSPTLVTACPVAQAHDQIRSQASAVCPPGAGGVRYLIRGPKGSALDVSTRRGSINIADYDGVVNAHTDRGDIKMLIPQYGNASVGTGNMTVIFASTDWPGTLHYSAQNGDVDIYVNENAKADVHLHTDNGTIFSDFPLRGNSHGQSETIDGALNGGAQRSIDVRVQNGSIRVLQLKPQI